MPQGVFTTETLVPVGLVITFFGAVVWLTTMYQQGRQNEKDINRLEEKVDKLEAENTSISDRMARMETKIDAVLEELKGSKKF